MILFTILKHEEKYIDLVVCENQEVGDIGLYKLEYHGREDYYILAIPMLNS